MKIVELKELKKMIKYITCGRINYKLSKNFSPVFNLMLYKDKVWYGETIKVKFCPEFLVRNLKKYYKVDEFDENSLIVHNIYRFF